MDASLGYGCQGYLILKKAMTKKPSTSKPRSNKSTGLTDESRSQVSFEGLLELAKAEDYSAYLDESVHVLGSCQVCSTERRARTREEIESSLIIEPTSGKLLFWAENQILHWRFGEASFMRYKKPELIKAAVRSVFFKAITAWGDSAPIRFKEEQDAYDFEIHLMPIDDIQAGSYTAARSFFPDSGQHRLRLYPAFFEKIPDEKERVDALIHELGHVFGLRHFMAFENGPVFSGAVYGANNPLTIMNYGALSELTPQDKSDLSSLYREVWSGRLTNVNRTPVELVRPWHG